MWGKVEGDAMRATDPHVIKFLWPHNSLFRCIGIRTVLPYTAFGGINVRT